MSIQTRVSPALGLRTLACLAALSLAACSRAPAPAAAPDASPAAPASASAPVASSATPAEAVGGLYSALQSMGLRGAPKPEQLAQLEPWLDPALRDLLRDARRVHDEARAAFPSEKPPFNDGDLFTSLFEGPASFEVGEVGAPAPDGSRRVTVAFTYGEPPQVTRWQDQVVVRPGGRGFVVADIQYGGNWEFGNRGSLVEALRAGTASAAPDAAAAPDTAAAPDKASP